KPAFAASAAASLRRWRCASWSSTMWSQPSHLSSSSLVQSEASPFHRRLTLWLVCQSSSAASTAFFSGAEKSAYWHSVLSMALSDLFFLFDGGQQSVESVSKELDTLVEKLLRHFLHGDAGARQVVHGLVGGEKVPIQCAFHLPMIAKSVKGRRWNGVDCVRTDEVLHVEHVAVARILGTSAGPEQALCLGAAGSQRFPSRAGKQFFIFPVRLFSVRDGHFAQQAVEQIAFLAAARVLEFRRQL